MYMYSKQAHAYIPAFDSVEGFMKELFAIMAEDEEAWDNNYDDQYLIDNSK